MRWNDLMPTLLLCGLVLLAPAGAAGAGPVPLTTALADLNADDLIEIHTRVGTPLRGHPLVALGDTLFLRAHESDTLRYEVTLDEILLVRRWESNAGRGATAGALSGLVIAGGYGALLGAYLSSLDGNDNVVGGAVAGFALVGALGAAGGGLIGGGIGALSHSWYQVWPEHEDPPRPELQRAPPGETRLGLFGGLAQSLTENYEVTRLSLRTSLRRDLGTYLSLGPEISFDDFDGAVVRTGPNGAFTSGFDSIVKFSLTGVVRSPRPGRTPYFTAGTGWFISNDAYLGAHVGGGMQWRRASRNDFSLDLRYNFGLWEVDANQVGSYWTAGLSCGFSL